MKKNGFVSTTLIYAFFIIFLTLMIFLLNSYSRNRYLLSNYKNDIKNSFAENSLRDINVYLMIWDNESSDYEYREKIPSENYNLDHADCENGSKINYSNGKITFDTAQKETCYLYFSPK